MRLFSSGSFLELLDADLHTHFWAGTCALEDLLTQWWSVCLPELALGCEGLQSDPD